MNYELAFKLKEAGFPQHSDFLLSSEEVTPHNFTRDIGHHRTFDYSIYPIPELDDFTQGKARASAIMSRQYLESEEGQKYTVYYPTLEELIEACGSGFARLWRPNEGWCATGTNDFLDGLGSTPTIAVANLWLALNEKK